MSDEGAQKRRRVAEDEHRGVGTIAIHAGQEPDAQTGAVCVPISLATTFAQASPGVTKGFEYSRTHNPTRTALQDGLEWVARGMRVDEIVCPKK